jgi:transcriptional regulator with XRE-family HTH domain
VREVRTRERGKLLFSREERKNSLRIAQEAMKERIQMAARLKVRKRIQMAAPLKVHLKLKEETQMPQVSIEASGRFGQMFAAAVSRERLSLRDIAAKLQYTYEQMRKLWIGTSSPSPLLLKDICRVLHLDFDKAQEAANADRAERKFGTASLTIQGRDPRLADIEELLPQLSDQEWDMFVAQMRGFVHLKRRS